MDSLTEARCGVGCRRLASLAIWWTPPREDTMKRFSALRWFDSAFVFVAMCGVFMWQWLTPEYRVLSPVRVKSRGGSRRSR